MYGSRSGPKGSKLFFEKMQQLLRTRTKAIPNTIVLYRPNFWSYISIWRKHCSTCKLLWKSMNLNCEICIIAHKVIIERVALLYSGIVLFRAQGLRGANGDFGLLHGLWAWKHYFTYKLVWKSMNSNRKICITAHKAIIKWYNGILLFRT